MQNETNVVFPNQTHCEMFLFSEEPIIKRYFLSELKLYLCKTEKILQKDLVEINEYKTEKWIK